MSAWDIAGAVFWTSLAVFLLTAVLEWVADPAPPEYGRSASLALVLGLLALGASAFCIARLFGAHA